ncbi:MAG: indolepyruvate ferredoxin oxidoreductase subunit alpha [Spirochaetaceae bacterium]|jgi:indolepyruvate ferredoxin oxidoreductase alpha subunit|nr:indolepyruvate ferredoxin oxidoreductase subunit alpha [Spirochaetaceae bacterium]
MYDKALLGDEAAALGALHAGISAAYGYPGTPSTEILARLIAEYERGGPPAAWCANEKTALEAGLGVSFAGRRALVTMKHVGLNVASDPFVNAALLGIQGGLVIAVADDPGMHSSQNEQDSRFYAAFALVPCLEPRSQQEAYDMAREAFDLSERFKAPVLLRLTTRLSHARAGVRLGEQREQNPLSKAGDRSRWSLLPAFARRNYQALLDKQPELLAWSTGHKANAIEPGDRSFAVITAGVGGNYYEENKADLPRIPTRLHIGAYPLPVDLIRKVCAAAERVLVLEEGQPFIEERLRGILPRPLEVLGRLSGTVNRAGELDPDSARKSLGLPPRENILSAREIPLPPLPPRPPQLCQGCPHRDSYEAILKAASGLEPLSINADIGCYSLGALPPYQGVDSIVCMGASVGMAKGAADAGIPYALGVIGDSTFFHSGITGLIDAAAANTPMTLIILDNRSVAMTGCQDPVFPSDRLRALLLGIGILPERILELEAKKHLIEENARRLRAEITYPGLSVAVFRRECLEAARKRQKKARGSGSP